MSDESTLLTIKIEYEDSISLSDFKESLEGWNNQYTQYISQTADPQADTRRLKVQIDKMVNKLYGLTEGEVQVVEGNT